MKKQTFGKSALSLAVAFVVGSLTTQVMAQTKTIESSSVLVDKTREVRGSLVEVGNPVKSKNLKGFAKELPIIAVLKQITPNEWVVKKAKGRTLDLQKQVSWSGGKTWVETLRDIAENNQIEALVNWDEKEVVLAELEVKKITQTVVKSEVTTTTVSTAKPTNTAGVFELSTDVVTEGSSGQTAQENVTTKEEMVEMEQMAKMEAAEAKHVEPVKVVAPVVIEKTWGFEGKDNLKDVVNSWGQKAGYRVVYTAENYPLDKQDTRVFSGEFDGEDGPIKQLSVDYGSQSRVKKPLSFIFFQNGTLVVEDLRFEQSGYPQYIQK